MVIGRKGPILQTLLSIVYRGFIYIYFKLSSLSLFLFIFLSSGSLSLSLVPSPASVAAAGLRGARYMQPAQPHLTDRKSVV